MAESVDNPGSDSAEKAYAAAAEEALAKADAASGERPAPLEFPAKPKRVQPKDVAAPVVASPAPVEPAAVESKPAIAEPVAPVAALPAELEADLVMPSKPALAKAPVAVPPAAPAKLAVPAAAKQAVAAKPRVVAKKPVALKKALPAKAAKPAAAKPVAAKPPINSKPAFAKSAVTAKPKITPAFTSTPTLTSKEPTMTTTETTDFAKTVKTAAADVETKAKQAFAKGSKVFDEAASFAKGNVEALVTSGKILGAGLQNLGKTYAAEGKSVYATATADVKELAAVKSPVDFVRIQTAILRRNLDHAFDFGGKNSEAVLKLAGDAFAPISARASLALEKVKKAA